MFRTLYPIIVLEFPEGSNGGYIWIDSENDSESIGLIKLGSIISISILQSQLLYHYTVLGIYNQYTYYVEVTP